MADLATLAIKVDSTDVASGVGALDRLTDAGVKAEKSVGQVAGAATRTAAAMNGVTVSAGAQRAGMQQLSFQIGDVAQQFALGAKPMQIFAQQAGQVVGAVSLMTGETKGLIGFLGGPWGAVMIGAVSILGSLYAAHSQAADGSKEQQEAAEELSKAIDQLHASTVRATQSTYAAAQASLQDAFAKQQQTIETRKAAIAELELAKAKAASANASAGAGGPSYFTTAQVGAAAGAEATVRDLDAQIGKLNSDLGKTTQTIRGLQGQIASNLIAEQFDKNAAATGRFNRTMDTLNAELRRTGDINAFSAGVAKARVTLAAEEAAAKGSTSAHRTRKEAVSEAQRAYDQALKSTDRYIESLEYEIEKIGKTPVQLRELEIARMKEAAATDEQRKQIDKLSASREAALAKQAAEKAATAQSDYERKTLQPLRDELALLGLTGVALIDKTQQQKLAALATEEEAFKADALAKGLSNVNALWLDYYMTSQDLINGESVLARDKLAAEDFADAMRELQSIAGEFDFGAAFGTAGDALNNMVDSMARLSAGQSEYARAIKAAGGDQVKIATATAAKKKLEVNETFALIGATKSLFKEQSVGYQVLGAAEKAYAAIQAVNTIKNVAAGASKIFASLGPWGFPVVAAMLGVMAGLGFSGGSSTQVAPPSAEDLQNNAGTGSVLGDAGAKSNSIANSLEIVAANSNRDLEYSNQMLRSLRSIDTSIGALAINVAKQISVSGSMFDTGRLNLGSSGSGGFLGIGGSSTTRNLYDLGVNLNSGSVADIIANGISGQTYQIVQQVKKKSGFLGIGGGTKTTYQTTTGSIDASITSAISDVVASLRSGLVEAANVVGLQGAQALIDGFQVNIGKISFKDMTGQEIEDQLNAIFSKVGDDLAGALLPSLATMQQIGEGLFETFVRVAREYQVVDMALASIGKTFGAVGVASLQARDELVQLFGSLDDFAEATTFFRDNFLTEAERIAPVARSVSAELERLGLSGVATREQFKATVLGLDLTTVAGREMYAALLAVAPAFDKVAKYAEAANKTMSDAFKKTVNEFQGYANALTKYRDSLRSGELSRGNAYEASRKAFLTTAGLAAEGDATGLAGLENAGKTFLTASKANATSLTAYLRDVASVANAVDKGIFAATETADYAQLQLDALTASTALLQSIDTGIANIGGQLAGPVVVSAEPVGTGSAPSANETNAALLEEITRLRSEAAARDLQLAQQNATIIRLFNRWDGDGLLIRTDSDTPIQTQVV